MKYNTEEKKLVMPEYGRNIQNMVDYCITIEDREERKRCADTIINIMGNMFPHLRDVNDFKHILWDHLAIMADFKLDIDYPYEIVKKEDLYSRPPRIPYNCRKAGSFWMKRYISWRKAAIYSLATIRTRRKIIHVKVDEFICHRRRLPVVR